MSDKEFNAHYRCAWCNSVRSKRDIMFYDDFPICRDRPNCKESFEVQMRPNIAPRSKGFYDKG